MKRAKFEGLRRNVAIAMGNSGLERYRERLEEWSGDEDVVVREAAEWALERLGSK